jgi:hypothetical protein
MRCSTRTNALNEMLKRVQHDKRESVISNLFRILEFGNVNKSIAFVLIILNDILVVPSQIVSQCLTIRPVD